MNGHAALQQVMRSLRQLASVPSRISAPAADLVSGFIAQQFDEQRDPYGEPWEGHAESTVRRWGEHPILDLGGDLKDVDVSPLPGSGVGITLGAEYGRFHQTGTSAMPARRILPDNRGLPAQWSAALRDLAQNEMGRSWRPV